MYHLDNYFVTCVRYLNANLIEHNYRETMLPRVCCISLYHWCWACRACEEYLRIRRGRTTIIPPLFPRVSPAPRIDSGKAERLLTVYRWQLLSVSLENNTRRHECHARRGTLVSSSVLNIKQRSEAYSKIEAERKATSVTIKKIISYIFFFTFLIYLCLFNLIYVTIYVCNI